MKIVMPQELQVWYILPALRREFAKSLVNDFNLTQKKTADLLGVTEAAISQYFGSKRAREISFSTNVLDKIKEACHDILEEDSTVAEEIYKLSISREVMKSMCKLHQKQDGNVSAACNICFEHNGFR